MPGQRAKNKSVVNVPMQDTLRDKIDNYAKEHKILHRGKPNRAAVMNAIAQEMMDRHDAEKKAAKKK